MEKSYTISRFEECGDSLFICLNSTNNSVYLEHFFTTEEKLDQAGTIEKLVAELELMDEAYVAPLPVVSKMEEAKLMVIKPTKILMQKEAILVEREEARLEMEASKEEFMKAIDEVAPLEQPILEEVTI